MSDTHKTPEDEEEEEEEEDVRKLVLLKARGFNTCPLPALVQESLSICSM